MPKNIEIGQCFTELLKIIVASFYEPRYTKGNNILFFNSLRGSGKTKNI